MRQQNDHASAIKSHRIQHLAAALVVLSFGVLFQGASLAEISKEPATATDAPKTEDKTSGMAQPVPLPSLPSKQTTGVQSILEKSESSVKTERESIEKASEKTVQPDEALSAAQKTQQAASSHAKKSRLMIAQKEFITKTRLSATTTTAAPSVAQITEQRKAASSKVLQSDPETLPLNLASQSQASSVQRSTPGMIRMTLSLLAVLGLFLGFVKLILPRLMARYPDFFENLKRRSESVRQAKITDPPPSQPVEKTSWPFLKTEKSRDSKRAWIEKMSVDRDHFQVISSVSLGKGKELHLVEIRGRQLVLATTAYSVNLITDLSGDLSGFSWETDILPVENPAVSFDKTEPEGNEPEAQRTALESTEAAAVKPYASPQVSRKTETKTSPPSAEPEAVIVLEDYDDIYGS